jgi:glycosyltransferase involved in cell wall biosynthesis
MDDEPLVSVVIPAYNYARYLGATLQAILAQSYRNLEVIVVNDGSTDNTLEVVEKFSADKRLKCQTQRNQGAIIATNRGIELSKGEYIASCGSDDLWTVDHIKVLMDAFRRHPDAGLVFDNAEYFHESGNNDKVKFAVPAEVSRELNDRVISVRETFVRNWITGITFLVRREVLNDVGLIDPELHMVGDLHFLYRIVAHRPVYFVDHVGAKIRIHDANMTVLEPHYKYGVRSLEDLRKHYPDVCRKIGWNAFARKLGRKYYRLARHYERTGDLENARMAYKNAFLTRKTRPNYYWGYLRLSLASIKKISSKNGHPV